MCLTPSLLPRKKSDKKKICDEQRSSHVMGRRAKKFSRAKCAHFLWTKSDFAREKISSLFNITWLLRASSQIFFSSLFQNFTNFRSQVFSQPTVRTSLPTPRPQHRRKLTSGSFDMAQLCRPLCDFTSACAHQKPVICMTGVFRQKRSSLSTKSFRPIGKVCPKSVRNIV